MSLVEIGMSDHLRTLKMINHLHRIGLGIAAVTLLASLGATGQDAVKKGSTETSRTASQPDNDSKTLNKKISFADVTKASTEEAARSAAHEVATTKSKKADAGQDPDSVVDCVTEFSPASHASDSTSKIDPKISRKSSKSKIHGEGYGGLDPTNSGNRHTGGAAGTTSNSGKTSVYVQSEQTRSTTSTPH